MILFLCSLENLNFGSYVDLVKMPSSTIRYLYDYAVQVMEERVKALKKTS